MDTYRGNISTYTADESTWGGVASVGYSFSRSVGTNFFLGVRSVDPLDKTEVVAGLEMELLPVHIPLAPDFDLIDFGLLVGGSTLQASDDNIGTIHVGARLNINFSRAIGFAAIARANMGFYGFEAGLTARL